MGLPALLGMTIASRRGQPLDWDLRGPPGVYPVPRVLTGIADHTFSRKTFMFVFFRNVDIWLRYPASRLSFWPLRVVSSRAVKMKVLLLHCGLQILGTGVLSAAVPTAVDTAANVTYKGLYRNGIEAFLNIPYGQDTGGEHRFKPPRPYTFQPGSEVVAQSYGPSCPQPLGDELGAPLVLGNVTDTSEDCLNLNIARPQGTVAGDKLPVMVWIHGGSFWSGQNSEITVAPDGLILESVENGLPIVHVALNYRLGVFGFARSAALESEGSENAGLRDQRLAIEWVRDNIEHFGGDPDKITLAGQSTGGIFWAHAQT